MFKKMLVILENNGTLGISLLSVNREKNSFLFS